MKKPWLILVLIVAAALAVIVHWPRHPRTYDLPPALDAGQLAALSDGQIVYAATMELSYSLADVAPADLAAHGQNLPEAARHLLALSWLVDDNGPVSQPKFLGFAHLLASTAPHLPTLTDIAAAYRAIGAPGPAAVVEEAQQLAAKAGWKPGAGPDPFGTVDRALVEQSTTCDVVRLLRAYVRANIADIAAVRAQL